ncbi:MAG: NAD(P)H-dependent oxidoreductase subunit E [Spirochaetales bacterium]|nr:NAD(P)H-dependent oxidoreductase subunit E [Spirochaetales bacterium]
MDREIEIIAEEMGTERDKLLPFMQEVLRCKNYLSEDSLRDIASAFQLSSAEVYGVASFYSFIETSPPGRHIIRLCKTVCCDLKNKDLILHTLERHLRIHLGETTADGKFSLLSTNCIGWCHESPAMMINDKIYTRLTPESTLKALEEWD